MPSKHPQNGNTLGIAARLRVACNVSAQQAIELTALIHGGSPYDLAKLAEASGFSSAAALLNYVEHEADQIENRESDGIARIGELLRAREQVAVEAAPPRRQGLAAYEDALQVALDFDADNALSLGQVLLGWASEKLADAVNPDTPLERDDPFVMDLIVQVGTALLVHAAYERGERVAPEADND